MCYNTTTLLTDKYPKNSTHFKIWSTSIAAEQIEVIFRFFVPWKCVIMKMYLFFQLCFCCCFFFYFIAVYWAWTAWIWTKKKKPGKIGVFWHFFWMWPVVYHQLSSYKVCCGQIYHMEVYRGCDKCKNIKSLKTLPEHIFPPAKRRLFSFFQYLEKKNLNTWKLGEISF